MICTRSKNLVLDGAAVTFRSWSANLSFNSVYYTNNYYEDLGVSKYSTHGEVKAAYYKLSMLYHPDKNQGSEEAAKKFRQITKAYEVLGNYKLRKLYDKGIIHTAGAKFANKTDDVSDVSDVEPPIEDDPTTKFYKSRFTKSTVTNFAGRTAIYNFDEWSRAHYGNSFQRRKLAKEKYEGNIKRQKLIAFSFQTDILLFGLLFLAILMYTQYLSDSSSLDKPRNADVSTKEKGEAKK